MQSPFPSDRYSHGQTVSKGQIIPPPYRFFIHPKGHLLVVKSCLYFDSPCTTDCRACLLVLQGDRVYQQWDSARITAVCPWTVCCSCPRGWIKMHWHRLLWLEAPSDGAYRSWWVLSLTGFHWGKLDGVLFTIMSRRGLDYSCKARVHKTKVVHITHTPSKDKPSSFSQWKPVR